jgi:hypothetical protein
MSKAHVCGSPDGTLCGEDGLVALTSNDLCQRCQLRVYSHIVTLTDIAETETVGAVECEWCHKAGGGHRRTCPREKAARALGYKSVAHMAYMRQVLK